MKGNYFPEAAWQDRVGGLGHRCWDFSYETHKKGGCQGRVYRLDVHRKSYYPLCVCLSLCGAGDQTQGLPCTANELCPQSQEALIGVIQRT